MAGWQAGLLVLVQSVLQQLHVVTRCPETLDRVTLDKLPLWHQRGQRPGTFLGHFFSRDGFLLFA